MEKEEGSKIKFRSIGKNVLIRNWVRIARPENIIFSDNVMIDDFVLLSGGRDEALTRIGNYVHVACFSNIGGGGGVTLEDFSGISPGCRLFSEADDYVHGGLMNPTVPPEFHVQTIKPIILKQFVILGANCVVLPGVTIGEGATVGACSLVIKDLEPWTVNVGIPAKPIKMRNRAEVLRRAEELRRKE